VARFALARHGMSLFLALFQRNGNGVISTGISTHQVCGITPFPLSSPYFDQPARLRVSQIGSSGHIHAEMSSCHACPVPEQYCVDKNITIIENGLSVERAVRYKKLCDERTQAQWW
jgi:hypothetical protein